MFFACSRGIAALVCAVALAACAANPYRLLAGVNVTQGSVTLHYVRVIASPAGFVYETGSTVEGERPQAISFDETAPSVFAERNGIKIRVHGGVTEPEATQQLADRVTEGLDLIQSTIWPGSERLPVQVDLLIRSEDGPQSIYQRRRLDRAVGWSLTFAIDPVLATNPALHEEVVDFIAHELYHLMIRERGYPETRLGGQHGDMYEEVTASLYGRCATILSGQATTFSSEPLFSVAFDTENGEKDVYAPLPDFWLQRLMDDLERDFAAGDEVPYLLHVPLRITAFNELSSGQWRLEPETPQAERLLSICREYAPQPTAIRFWLQEIANDGNFYELSFPNGEPAIPANPSATAS